MNDVTRPRSESSAVKTVAKVLDILDQLGTVGRPVSVSEIASLTGINVSTAHRLLQTQLGLICRQLAPLRSMAAHLVKKQPLQG